MDRKAAHKDAEARCEQLRPLARKIWPYIDWFLIQAGVWVVQEDSYKCHYAFVEAVDSSRDEITCRLFTVCDTDECALMAMERALKAMAEGSASRPAPEATP